MSREYGSDRLHALVDGQLTAADKARLLEEMERDADLRQQACELHRLKEYVQCAFEDIPAAPAGARRRWWPDTRTLGRGVAALLLVAVGYLGGRWVDAPTAAPVAAAPDHVILHVNSSDWSTLQTALDEVEFLAFDAKVQVEVVANGGGLDLVRVDHSPVAERVRTVMAEHPNVQFVACNISMRKQQIDGRYPVLIQGTQVAPSAAEHILQRLEQGWRYVRA